MPPKPARQRSRLVGRAGHQRVHAVAHRLGYRVGPLVGDHGQQPAGRAVAGVRAQRRHALGDVAPHPPRAPQDVRGVQVVALEQLLEQRAAQRLLGLVAGVRHGDLRQCGHRRHVEVLAGVGPALAQHQHGAQLLAARRDRHLGHDLRRSLGVGAGQPRRHVALERRRAARRRPESQARDDHRDRRLGVRRRDLRDAVEPLPRQHGAHHLQVGAAGEGSGSGAVANALAVLT